MRLWSASLMAAFVSLLTSAQAFAADFNVTAANFNDYTINGAADPTLTLTRGKTYTFNINTPAHPFYIQTEQGAGCGCEYNAGVIGNGTTVGTVTFQVPPNAPNTLYYQCGFHEPMWGVLQIVNAQAPAAGTTPLLMLGLCLMAVGLGVVGRRRLVRAGR